MDAEEAPGERSSFRGGVRGGIWGNILDAEEASGEASGEAFWTPRRRPGRRPGRRSGRRLGIGPGRPFWTRKLTQRVSFFHVVTGFRHIVGKALEAGAHKNSFETVQKHFHRNYGRSS